MTVSRRRSSKRRATTISQWISKTFSSYTDTYNPASFKPIIRAISLRVEHTHSWTVALKSLMLIHGLFLGGSPPAESIGRLPFDLSGFGKTKSRFSRTGTGRFSIFVRAYFSFLDGRSILYFNDRNRSEFTSRLEIIVEMQRVVDSLMRIKPIGETMETPLVIEAMEYVISEILEIHGQICRGFADFLSDVESNSEKSEAELAMKIVAKSLSQGEELVKYFDFCRGFGVANAREIPDFVPISGCDMIDRTVKITPLTAETDLVASEDQKPLLVGLSSY
ncbi:unnamed protein product [Microthlaspi erraticum]|uniref:ENTH domain-containing protein n=1 Tax=Microthlaspi erraticum TaxID=1685480 RepID=A0A6D2JRV2_9BRAS|nr:unnamed protein product [Microthlaspi erraticum]